MNDELYHYGVKGMKWGIRRKRDSVGSSKNSHNKNYTDKQRKNDRASQKRKATAKRIARKGARAATKAVSTIGVYVWTDEIFFNGAGRKAAIKGLKTVGRMAVSAVLKARGVDVRWRD